VGGGEVLGGLAPCRPPNNFFIISSLQSIFIRKF